MEKVPQEAVLIGAGIMSATLSVILKKINPDIKITVFERLDVIAAESSDAFNNAGTGHSAFCELNYTPQAEDGSVSISKAIDIAAQFETSKEFWAYLVENGYVRNPKNFIRTTPHMSFVWGDADVDFLKNRHDAMSKHPFFKDMEYSQSWEKIKQWAPLIIEGRNKDEEIAATRMEIGTDVNFGELTREIFNGMSSKGEVNVRLSHEVKSLKKQRDGNWSIRVKDLKANNTKHIRAEFVFVGAGGSAILLLQKSKIKEARGYGGFPVGGEWLVCLNENIIKQHKAKVYGKAKIGAPPMSVPHLDTRVIEGKQSLLFGPYATFSTKFLKNGSWTDLFKSLKISNLGSMVLAGWHNMSLTKYLIEQVRLTKSQKIESLKEYFPEVQEEDWVEQTAGQRVQVIEKVPGIGGVLKFGTEIIASSDGSIAGLLGASPGASTSVTAMLNVLKKCFPTLMENEWKQSLEEVIPSIGHGFATEEQVEESRKWTKEALKLDA